MSTDKRTEEKDTKKNKSKIYYSPSSKAPLMTPIKSALDKSDKSVKQFIANIRRLVNFQEKENL